MVEPGKKPATGASDKPVGIGPDRLRAPAGLARQGPEALDRIRVAVLGVDGLARGEGDALVCDADGLRLQADEVHLDARRLGIEEGPMGEGVEIEFSTEFVPHPHEQVAVESRRHPGRVVIGGVEHRLLLHEIDADDQGRADTEHPPEMGKQPRRLRRLEIADGRAGEEPGHRAIRQAGREGEGPGEIRCHGGDREVREVPSQSLGLTQEEALRDVDGNVGGEVGPVHHEAPDLHGRAAAELDEVRLGRQGRGDGRTLSVEDAQFRAGRIILGLPRDRLE